MPTTSARHCANAASSQGMTRASARRTSRTSLRALRREDESFEIMKTIQGGMKMRAVRYHEFGGPEKLQIEQIARPELDGENVLIQITRAGVSPLDDKVRGGVLPPTMRKSLPLVPGASAVGRVADPGTSGHAPGTRVLLCGWGYGTKLDGTWREFAAVPSSHLVPIPDEVS